MQLPSSRSSRQRPQPLHGSHQKVKDTEAAEENKSLRLQKKEGDDPITKLRVKKTSEGPKNARTRQQPPWFTGEVEELWRKKRIACKRSQRARGNQQLREAAKIALKAFEQRANEEKERLYEEFSRSVTQDRSLHKFWQLHRAMNNNKSKSEVPDFRREDDVWVRTPEEKGKAFFDRFVQQTDQGNEEERITLMRRLQYHYREELLEPHEEIKEETLLKVIKQATNSAPGPDGVKYTDLKALDDQDMQKLTEMLNKSLEEHNIPDDWLDSHLAPVPKPNKDRTSIKGYRIVTMQNMVGRLLEKMVARRLANQLENDNLLPSTLGSYRRGKDTWANAAVLASDVYDAFERKEETLVVALDLEDAYNRVDYRILMRTLFNMKIDPYIILWIGNALLKRKVALRVGPWTSEVRTITPGLPQGSALSPVLFNVYTVGITSNQLEGPGRTLSFADDFLAYRHGRERRAIADSTQQELDRLGEWCEENKGKIHPDKACVLWCSLNNHAVKAQMPPVFIDGKELQRVSNLPYLGVLFDRSLCGSDHISQTIIKARKGLIALKTMATARMSQRILVILYQALIKQSVVKYGFGLLTLSTAQLKRLEVIQNEAMRAILGCTKDTSAEAMRHLLDFATMAEFHKLAQVDAFLKVAADTKHPLHDKVGNRPDSRLKRGSEWMTEATHTIESCGISIECIRRGTPWVYFIDYIEQYTKVIATLGRECREWEEGKTDEAVEAIIAEHSRPDDVVVFTDGSVKRGIKSGWGFTIRKSGVTQHEASGAIELTTSSMIMEIKAITEALKYRQDTHVERAVIVTDSMCTLQKVMNCFLYADWAPIINNSALERLVWIFTPGHAGVEGNERADRLADAAIIDNNITLDGPTVLQIVAEQLKEKRPQSASYTLSILKEKGIQAGAGATSDMRGASRRHQNQMLMETLSIYSLRRLLKMRAEQAWECPACNDVRVHDR